jgi:transposase
MIRSLLLRNGVADVPVRRVFSSRGLTWLETVILPGEAAASLARLRHVLTAIQVEAEAAEALVIARAESDPIAQALDAIVGIGPVLGLTIRAEVGDIARFRRGAELASYAGLVPRVDASADRYWTGRITREGSPWLRWALVEAAMHAIRRPDAVGRWARQLAVRKGCYKARIALARRLCDDIVRVWTVQAATTEA